MHHHPSSSRRQRGVAALVVTLLLCLTMVLAVAFAHRDIAAEERRSANDLRTAQAFEAAEAGLSNGRSPAPTTRRGSTTTAARVRTRPRARGAIAC